MTLLPGCGAGCWGISGEIAGGFISGVGGFTTGFGFGTGSAGFFVCLYILPTGLACARQDS